MNCCLQILYLVLYQDSGFVEEASKREKKDEILQKKQIEDPGCRHLFSLRNHEQLGDGGLVFHYESRVLNKQIGTMLNG